MILMTKFSRTQTPRQNTPTMVYVPPPPESFKNQFVLCYPRLVTQLLPFRVSSIQVPPNTLQLTPTTVPAADHTLLRTKSVFVKGLIQESAPFASGQTPPPFRAPVST